MSGDPRLDPVEEVVRRAAADVAPALLQQVLDESRSEAAAILKGRLTAAMVREMERLLRRAGPAQGSVGDPTPGDTPTKDDGPAGGDVHAVVPLIKPDTPALSGWYVYGITRAVAAHALDVGPGVDGAPVEAVPVGGLAAVVSPLRDARGWDIEGQGDDAIEALAPRARAHEAVLERVMDIGSVLPLRFGVLYPDVDRLRDLLRDRSGAFDQALGAIEGQSEWGLTITSEGEAGEEGPAVTPADGRDYLSRRRTERVAGQARAERMSQVAAAVHEGLRDVSTGAVIHRAGASGRRANAVLRASYLVPVEGAEAFRAACEALLTKAPPDLGLSGELTGPWPPYHFCDISLEEVPA